jgi:hypothetical protein
LNRPAMRSASSSVRFLQSIKSACERAIGLATKIGLIEGSAICFLGAISVCGRQKPVMYLFQGRSLLVCSVRASGGPRKRFAYLPRLPRRFSIVTESRDSFLSRS